ncbi:HAMP domain-containing sensor histidine kinase [Mesobacillus zeae]
MLRYWTTRYVLTLFLGLIILGAGSLWMIKQTTLENRLNLLEYLAAEMADRVVESNGEIGFGNSFGKIMDQRTRVLQMDRPPQVIVADLEGNLASVPEHHGMMRGERESETRIIVDSIPVEFLTSKDKIQIFNDNAGTKVYAVKAPIFFSGEQAGWSIVLQDEDTLTEVNQEYRLLVTLLAGLGLLGWLVIYLLSKRIVKPVQEVANAAAQIREGNYDIKLQSTAKEQEIFELTESFREMASRLMQLEQLRAELLAGVTHDLKTPMTSISGLVQAVRDGVVTPTEEKEFLDITLKEIKRLQNMIGDLLDFNSLAAGAVSIHPERGNMAELVPEIVREWVVSQQDTLNYEVIVPEQAILRETDPFRLKQIMVNLLNNAFHSLDEEGRITVTLTDQAIDVTDTGTGIPESEQPYVFERFFRGEKKKLKVRGLGLGLPFSKLMAKSLGADLLLKESSPKGSTFTILWKK